ncbi:MAG: M48 family metalloprotease [Candidatus Micrarchaeota archaeon]|nr:M48 family metalloprotease [Candidatus Micrarchaeota archaeon]MDE1824651.1 M48 family metalloprotease [Candidatus Micrarchaeota archaeon]MDE1849860.1 M48 family metalloprotease [Candidatus Micrarchaeota archaeon]
MALFKSKEREKEEVHFEVHVLTKKYKKFHAVTGGDGKIHLERSAIKKLSRNGLKALIFHERFHQRWRQDPASRVFRFVAPFVLLISVLGIFGALLSLFYLHPNILYGILCAVILAYFVSVSFLAMYIQRISEAAADLYSAKEIGKANFVSGFEDRYKKYPSYGKEETFFSRLRRWRYLFEHRTKSERIKLVKET